MSYKTVLCAVDVSTPHSDVAVVQQGARLAALDGAQLDVITVVPDYGMSVVGSFFEGDHHEKATSEAQRLLNDLVVEAIGAEANEEVRHVVSTGSAYEQILKAAKAGEADLIVIGAHKPELRDYLLGPNAARVVRHAPVSVMVVRV